jgi:hypothetical protein
MGLFDGMLTGFSARKAEIEAQNLQAAHEAAQREGQVFQALINSPDPDIKALAVTGLLDSARPGTRKSGLAGWMGQMQANPALASIRSLIDTPHAVEEPTITPGLASRQTSGFIGTPPGQTSSMALPDQTPVTGGPPTPVQSHLQTTDVAGPAVGRVDTQTVLRPRQVFQSPEDAAIAQAKAKGAGDILGDVYAQETVGVPHDEAVKNALAWQQQKHGGAVGGLRFGGTMKGDQADAGARDTYGRPLDPEQYYRTQLHPTGQIEYIPTLAPAGPSMGADVNFFAKFLPGGRVRTAADADFVQQAIQAKKNALTPNQALTQARTMLPDATKEQQIEFADWLATSTAAPSLTAPGTPPAVSGAAPAASGTTAAPAAAGAGPVGAPPPAPTTTAAPPAGRKPASLAGSLPPQFSTATRESGKPLDPTIVTAVANAKSTNDLIDRALAALQPFETDNTPEGGMKLAQQYRQGIFNPDSGIAAQLADLSGLTAANRSALSAGGNRSLQAYIERRQHTPRLPTVSAAEWNASGVPTGLVGKISRLRGGGWDSPQMMVQKLQQIKAAGAQFIQEMESESQVAKNPIRPGSPPPGAPGAGGAAQPYLDPKTNQWILP